MKKKHKMNMTRPEFLDLFIDEYNEVNIGKIIPDQTNLIYAMYTVLLESDLMKSNIEQVDYDSNTIVVKMSNKSIAKEVKENYHNETLRFGYDTYKLHIKVDKVYVYVTLDKIESNDEDTID